MMVSMKIIGAKRTNMFPKMPVQYSRGSQLMMIKVKVKVTLVQTLRLCTGRTAHKESRGIALLFHDQRH